MHHQQTLDRFQGFFTIISIKFAHTHTSRSCSIEFRVKENKKWLTKQLVVVVVYAKDLRLTHPADVPVVVE